MTLYFVLLFTIPRIIFIYFKGWHFFVIARMTSSGSYNRSQTIGIHFDLYSLHLFNLKLNFVRERASPRLQRLAVSNTFSLPLSLLFVSLISTWKCKLPWFICLNIPCKLMVESLQTYCLTFHILAVFLVHIMFAYLAVGFNINLLSVFTVVISFLPPVK